MLNLDEKAKVIKIRFLDALKPIFSTNTFDFDEYLNLRDNSDFDKDWTESYELVEDAKLKLKRKDRVLLEKQAETLRESIFMYTIKGTGSSDLAAAISDDAGLIFEATALEMESSWINALNGEYLKLSLPKGKLIA